jgi:hypothetical protein
VRILIKEGYSFVKFHWRIRIRKEHGRHAKMPNRFTLRHWDEKFAETGSVGRKKSEKKKSVFEFYTDSLGFLGL